MHTDDVVTIANCGRAVCTRVAIIDDASLENVEEFVVTVEANSSLIPHVRFEDTQAVVTITDNDGIYIHIIMTVLLLTVCTCVIRTCMFMVNIKASNCFNTNQALICQTFRSILTHCH